ncbi:hypothetical protein D3C86_1943290 [compost metagenome]
MHREDAGAKAAQLLAQAGFGLGGIGGALVGVLHVCAAHVAVFIGQHQAEA